MLPLIKRVSSLQKFQEKKSLGTILSRDVQLIAQSPPEGELPALNFKSRNLTFPTPTVKPLLKNELLAATVTENDKLHPSLLLRYFGDVSAKGTFFLCRSFMGI